MSHDEGQNPRSSITASRRQVLGALGGAAALALLGDLPARAGEGGRHDD